jgi:hypothetical protein
MLQGWRHNVATILLCHDCIGLVGTTLRQSNNINKVVTSYTPVIQLSSQLRVRMIITWSLLKFISRSQASPATRLQSSYNRCTLRDAIVYTRDVRGHYCINIVIHLYYIKHEAKSSVLYLIKHNNKCFE